MAIISRTCPGWVRQTLENSCWAAVLESWSRADPRMMRLRQQSLITTWGEGPTGGITPVTKIPQIAAAYNLQWGGFRSGELTGFLTNHLASSYIFCAYTIPGWTHAVLIYRLRDNDVAFMDPDYGRYRVKSLTWIENHGPFAVMRLR
jgi:hypothetical protein